MEAKIIKQNQFEDKDGNVFRNFKLHHEWDFFWLSEKTFKAHAELIEIRDETIILKEPVENYFELEKKKNKNGEFLVLNPKKTGNAPSLITHHDKTETKNANSEESNTLTPKQKKFAFKGVKEKLKGIKLRELNTDKVDFEVDEPFNYKIVSSGTESNNPLKNRFVNKESLDDTPGEEHPINDDTVGLIESGKLNPRGKKDSELLPPQTNYDSLKEDKSNTKDLTGDKAGFEDKTNKKIEENVPSFLNQHILFSYPEESVTLTPAQERFAKLIAERTAKLGGAPTKLRKLNKHLKDFGDQEEKIDDMFGVKDGSDSSINLPKGMIETNMSVDELEDIIASGKFKMVAYGKVDDMLGAEDTSQVNFSDKKIAFINSLLQLSNKKNVDEKTRQRLVGLIGKELEKTGMVESEILRKIIADVENLKNAINYTHEDTVKNETEKPGFQSKKPAHKPRSTTKFLSNFKVDNDTGLKELVHKPNINTLDTHELLKQIKNHPVLSDEFGNGYKQGFEPINYWVRKETIELVKLFEKTLEERNTDLFFHPFGIDHKYTEQAKKFKRNYRFGPSGDDNYSSLRGLIQKIAKEEIKRFENYDLIFDPKEWQFDMIATFFSWKPALIYGLRCIFSEIDNNSNINGIKDFSEQKIIKIHASKDKEKEVVNIYIEDQLSKVNKHEDTVLKNMRGWEPVTKSYFWGLSNWSVLLDNENGSFELRILSDKVSEYQDEPIAKIDRKINAFVHKLSFYNL